MLWAFGHVHQAEGHADGTGGADDDLVAIFLESACSLNNEGQNRKQGLMSLLVYD